MPLTSFTVERYRSFVEPTTLEIRPLTLLFGYNSSGKSALARVLPLLRDSMGGAMYGPLALDSEVLRDAAYGDIRSRLDERNQMSFELSWEGEPSDICHIEFRLRDLGKEGHVLEQLIARDGRKLELVELRDEPGQKGQYKVKVKGQKLFPTQLTFEGLKPSYEDIRRVGKGTVPEPFRKLMKRCAERLQSLKESVYWLNAVRASPKRKGRARGEPARLDGSGAWAPDMLAVASMNPKDTLFRSVTEWIKALFGHCLHISIDQGVEDEYALMVQPTPDSLARVSIVDVGEGVSQVLPVLVLGELGARGRFGKHPTLVLEQPEMHLHPSAERSLAEWMCGVVQAPSKPRLVIETHSENLLLFVQLYVAQGKLPPEDVAVYWVETGSDGHSEQRKIPMDGAGKLKGWPPGVFLEDVDMARKLFLARRGA